MCSRARCSKCGKVTWRGCGAHVEQVLRDVSPEDRCRCEAHAPEGLLSGIARLFRGEPDKGRSER